MRGIADDRQTYFLGQKGQTIGESTKTKAKIFEMTKSCSRAKARARWLSVHTTGQGDLVWSPRWASHAMGERCD